MVHIVYLETNRPILSKTLGSEGVAPRWESHVPVRSQLRGRLSDPEFLGAALSPTARRHLRKDKLKVHTVYRRHRTYCAVLPIPP